MDCWQHPSSVDSTVQLFSEEVCLMHMRKLSLRVFSTNYTHEQQHLQLADSQGNGGSCGASRNKLLPGGSSLFCKNQNRIYPCRNLFRLPHENHCCLMSLPITNIGVHVYSQNQQPKLVHVQIGPQRKSQPVSRFHTHPQKPIHQYVYSGLHNRLDLRYY